MFGLPVLLLSPYAGRLVDRRGSLAFIVVGSLLPAAIAIAYTLISDPLYAVPLILVEATGFAMLNPALYAVVAANSPPGRSSTAQGLFGAAGTVGFIVASLIAGVLASVNIVYPLYVFSAVLVVSLVLGLLIGGRRLTAGLARPSSARPRRRRATRSLRREPLADGAGTPGVPTGDRRPASPCCRLCHPRCGTPSRPIAGWTGRGQAVRRLRSPVGTRGGPQPTRRPASHCGIDV